MKCNTPGGQESPIVEFAYNEFGQVTDVNVPDGKVIKFQYYGDANDANNYARLWKVIVDYNETDGLNITREYEYDTLGRVIEVNDPNGDITKLAYNELDRLTKITTPSPYNHVTNLSYSDCKMLCRVERERAGDNQILEFTYNALDKLKTITDPLSNVTVLDYDKGDNLADVNDAGRIKGVRYIFLLTWQYNSLIYCHYAPGKLKGYGTFFL